MIHYSCDVCKCALDSEQDLRYVVRMEVYTATSDGPSAIDDDRDHLEDIQDILECLDDSDSSDEQLGDDVYQHLRFDLCSECRKRFMQDPLGRRIMSQLDFSKN